MTDITIPPAALEAGARAICLRDGFNPDDEIYVLALETPLKLHVSRTTAILRISHTRRRTPMLKPEQVPEAVWRALGERLGFIQHRDAYCAAIAAALNAWPGMEQDQLFHGFTDGTHYFQPRLILPIPKGLDFIDPLPAQENPDGNG